jgi:putative transposase
VTPETDPIILADPNDGGSMRKSRFTEEQIIATVQKSAASAKTGELIRRHGISRETFYK